MRKTAKETDIPCPRCEEEESYIYMQVKTPGSETEFCLICPKCGEYLYFIGNITCVRSARWEKDALEKARVLLGRQGLLPEIQDKITLIERRQTMSEQFDLAALEKALSKKEKVKKEPKKTKKQATPKNAV